MAVRVGIIGLGGIGNIHIRTLSMIPEVELVGIADVDKAKLERFNKEFHVPAYTDYRELLDKGGLDAIYILTPPHLHRKMVEDAVEAGLHVFCEKPIAANLEDARAISELISASNIKFMTAFQERFNVSNLEAKDLIDNGSLGRIKYLRLNGRVSLKTFEKEGGWLFDRQKGGGVILEASVHYIDLVRWFTGSEIKTVYARSHKRPYETSEFDTDVIINLELDNGAFAVIDCTFDLPKGFPMDQRIEILGTDGVVYLDAFRNFMALASDKGVDIGGGQVVHTEGITYPDVLRQSKRFGAYKRESEHFISCLQLDREPAATVEDGLKAIEVSTAAVKSADTGAVVALPL